MNGITSKTHHFIKAQLAVVYMQLAILEPDSADAHKCLGDAFVELGRHEEATEAYKQAITLNPNESSGHFNLARTYLKMGNNSSALEEYKILETLDEELAKELNGLMKP